MGSFFYRTFHLGRKITGNDAGLAERIDLEDTRRYVDTDPVTAAPPRINFYPHDSGTSLSFFELGCSRLRQRRPGRTHPPADRLQFGVGIQARRREFATDAAAFGAAERRAGVERGESVTVDEDRARI